jgi:hypothetical protein
MRYHTHHYILEFWDKRTKSYKNGASNKNIERLRILTKKPYFNYSYMGKKRIICIQVTKIWESK